MFYSLRRGWPALLVIASLVLSACAPAVAPSGSQPAEAEATATPAAAAEAPVATEFAPMSVAAENCDYGGEFQAIESVDAQTVKFTLCYADPAFPSKVAFSSFGINDADYLEAMGGGGDLVEKPNGTGPYMVEEWRRGDQIIYKRFENYWGEKAIPETLIFRWSSESAQRLVDCKPAP